MKKVAFKNYVVLFIIIVVTIIIVLNLSNYYKRINNKTSIMYNNVPEITENELTDYIIEKPMIYMYIDDKNNLSNEKIEKELLSKIKQLNIKDYFVYIDTNILTDKFETFFRDNYNIEVNLNEKPILIVINDGKILNINYIDANNYNINSLINHEATK